jgi:hypothetical protein
MERRSAFVPRHPDISRRTALQAGAIGLLGLGTNHLSALRSAANGSTARPTARACIYIFLSGGLAQHESFDLKPHAPAEIRGDFKPISTSVPGYRVCELMPLVARQAHRFAVVRGVHHDDPQHNNAGYAA